MTAVHKTVVFLGLLAIISLGVRLYVDAHYYVINKDSTIYLYQAYALKNHQFQALKDCQWSSRLENINLYSLIIIPFYLIIKNWVLAGELVSTLAGVFTILLLFLIYRRYLSFPAAFILALIFAVHPIMVKENAEVMRDSLYWFFNAAGIYLFVKGFEENSKFMPLSGIAFCLSGWVRSEGFLIFLAALIFLLLKRNLKASLYYAFLPGVIFLLTGIYLSFTEEYFLQEFLQPIVHITNPFHNYLTESLKRFNKTGLLPGYPHFFGFVEKTLWLIALGVLIHKGLPTIYVPNLVFYFGGLKGLRTKLRKEGVQFLLFIALVNFLLFYFFVLERWYMEKRYMLPLVFSSAIIMGFGIERALDFLKNRKLRESGAIAFIILYILLTSLPKTLKPVRDDKVGLKNLAIYLGEISGKEILPKVFATDPRIIFYAQLNKKRWLCPKPPISKYLYFRFKNNPDALINYAWRNQFRYLVLNERYLFKKFDPLINKLKKDPRFKYHGLWKCSFGRLALFERKI